MSITDELRHEAANYPFRDNRDFALFEAIADRIDAEYESICYDYQREFEDWKFVHDTYFVELPKDADGEYIHIGDVMENLREDLEPSLHHRFTVYGIHYRAYGQECALTEDGYPSKLYRASETRHYHAPTVEDVLREFAEKVIDSQIPSVHPTYEEAIAEYVKRLTLVEGVDE